MNRYEREKPRTGGVRAAVNGARNRAFQADERCKEDDRGWIQPFANWQGWEELNLAIHATRRALILRDLMKHHELADTIRVAKMQIYRSSKCDRPALP